jgi:NAD(P)-dependent dehydrogenase (short-subunit alcohol dehydrogenase family)
MSGRLNGKVCLITGTGGAMGSAAAKMFAKEGGRIVGVDLNPQTSQATLDAVRAEGGEMVAMHPCDLTDFKQCQAAVEFAVRHYGRIDVLYNNAAMAYYGAVDEISNEDWYKTLNEEVNLVFLLTKAAWPVMKKTGASIINTASVSGWTSFEPLPAIAHTTAKGAVIAMTRHVAMEGRLHGIRCNSISPGAVDTPQLRPHMANPEFASVLLSKIMLGRIAQPHEIASAALFFASDESSFVTGADLLVDGGVMAWV